jgi:hypothetical protein
MVTTLVQQLADASAAPRDAVMEALAPLRDALERWKKE